ncbi:MAG TPA: DNA polymerase/3'-5' exonuclease PolX [Gemmatimonadales bacterium]|nr:DNA polymerase/3'-5' exonuclease PolX [Gemmatimonadales bacterium]
MDKPAVGQVLDEIARFLELKGENPFRVRAFENAARAVTGFPGDLADGVKSGALAEVHGIGKATLQIVSDLLDTGRSSVLDELREQIPPGLVEMTRIPGLGVTKIRQIHDALDIDTVTDLDAAAADGRLAALPRFGAKTADNVRRGIAHLRRSTEFRLSHHAAAEARSIRESLSALEGAARVEVAGSVRRRREVIRDLDFLIGYQDPAARDAIVKRLRTTPGVTDSSGAENALTLRFASGTLADVFFVTTEAFGLAWVRATGSAAHLAQLETRANERKVSLAHGAYPEEKDVYSALGLAWIPPELREGTGEIDAAAAGTLPRLVEDRDLRGFVHCHSNYSDGTTTIAEWAEACAAAGYSWMGLTDHGQGAFAGGLKTEDIGKQHGEIDAVNRANPSFTVLKGIEADILEDGKLDYDAATLDRFDFVIGSIHTRFGMTEQQMTDRVLKAMDDPHLTILGHPTGRLLLSRDPFPIDLERVLRRAADRGIAIEVNADPHRLDLDWRHVREARDFGVTVSIGADAHSVAGMANVGVGVGVARKGWVEADDVLNTRDVDSFRTFAKARR